MATLNDRPFSEFMPNSFKWAFKQKGRVAITTLTLASAISYVRELLDDNVHANIKEVLVKSAELNCKLHGYYEMSWVLEDGTTHFEWSIRYGVNNDEFLYAPKSWCDRKW